MKIIGVYQDEHRLLTVSSWLDRTEVFESGQHAADVLVARRDGRRPARPPRRATWHEGLAVETPATLPWLMRAPLALPWITLIHIETPLDQVESALRYRLAFPIHSRGDVAPVAIAHRPA